MSAGRRFGQGPGERVEQLFGSEVPAAQDGDAELAGGHGRVGLRVVGEVAELDVDALLGGGVDEHVPVRVARADHADGDGLGVAAGGTGVAIWLWLSSLLELGADPVGLADQNPGATDTMPHGVTTAGMVVALLALVVTGVLAIIDRRPAGQPPGAPQP